MHALTQGVMLIVDTVAGFLSVLLLLRFFMQLLRVSFANQIGAFVLALTNWLVLPLRKVIPGVFGLDFASLLPAYLLQVAVLAARIALGAGAGFALKGALLWAFGYGLLATLRLCVYLFIGLMIVQAVLSWVNPYSPLARPVSQLTGPLLRPVQRVVPPIANIDLSPLIVILIAQLLLVFLQ
jgi:YggT family protein